MMPNKKIIIFFLFCLIIIPIGYAFRIEMYEGESIVFKTKQGFYLLELVAVSDAKQTAVFRLNHEFSSQLDKDARHTFSDGSEIIMRNVMVTEAGESRDLIEGYFFSSGKNMLPLEELQDVIENSLQPVTVVEEITDLCTAYADCDDNNPCTIDICSGTPKDCSFDKQKGCILNNSCVPLATRMNITNTALYCGQGNEWEEQKTTGKECKFTYECLSNHCVGDRCVAVEPKESLWRLFLSWLDRLFF